MSHKPHYDREHHAKMATGVGDPQCFKGKAGKPKFKVGDKVRIKNLPDIFYTRCQMYTRGSVATVVRLVYESPPAEDEGGCGCRGGEGGAPGPAALVLLVLARRRRSGAR